MTTTTVPAAAPERERHELPASRLRISFIGAGTMGEAIIRRLIQRGVVAVGDAVANVPPAERRAWSRARCRCRCRCRRAIRWL